MRYRKRLITEEQLLTYEKAIKQDCYQWGEDTGGITEETLALIAREYLRMRHRLSLDFLAQKEGEPYLLRIQSKEYDLIDELYEKLESKQAMEEGLLRTKSALYSLGQAFPEASHLLERITALYITPALGETHGDHQNH